MPRCAPPKACEAQCAWGDGPDVMVVLPPLEGWPVDVANDGSATFGLSSEQAFDLGIKLLEAARDAAGIDRDYWNDCGRRHVEDLERQVAKLKARRK